MKAILDTHAFLWWIADSPQLSERVRDLLGDGDNEILFSAASAWEIAVKCGLGKLDLAKTPDKFIPEQLRANAFLPLPIELSHALCVYNLPLHHRDPFDRILVAQSILEGAPLVTRDEKLDLYDVETLW